MEWISFSQQVLGSRGMVEKMLFASTLMKTDEELKKENPELYKVAREGATERPYSGKYVDSNEDGMYHCAVCDTELFSSDTKLDSNKSNWGLQGWPSFSEPKNTENIVLKPDNSLGMERTEILCKKCGAHLGHIFPDQNEDGKVCDHYCVNSVSLELKKSASR